MAYIDGFVAPVPTAGRETYVTYAQALWPIFQDLGATAMWDCWGDDVPDGEVTSFRKAVGANDDETVVFAWTAWPDKATREAAWSKLSPDPALEKAIGDMPFDGKRMIFGGFAPILVAGDASPG
ncbi:MAG: DUF1428 domain-containing protein [Rhodobacter sp.]|nr:DUF1428 domain-containing protein [Rhodobacter sp.]